MARAKQTEIPLKGKGVAATTDKKLIALGDQFIDRRDKRATTTTEMGNVEKDILKRMTVLGIQQFRFGDQLAVLSTGKQHIKIKTIKVEGVVAPGNPAE